MDAREWNNRFCTAVSTFQQVVAAALRSAACVVVPGEALKPSFERWVPQQRIRAVHHGIVPSLASDLAERRRLARRECLTVLFLSNLNRKKGWVVTLEAAAEVLRQRRDMRFVFCGPWWPPSDEEYAHDLLVRWGIEDRVEFHGATTGEAKRLAFVEADIFVFPTYLPRRDIWHSEYRGLRSRVACDYNTGSCHSGNHQRRN